MGRGYLPEPLAYFDYFEKCLHFRPKLPYIKSGFSKNQGGIQKLE